MAARIFVNFPVRSAARAKTFYEAVGFTHSPDYSSDDTAGMAFSDTIFLMLLEHERFRTFTDKAITDAETATEVLNCLALDSREEVDAMIDKAVAAGGAEIREAQDHGFMYARSFRDLDHHTWDIIWLNPEPQAA